MNTIIAEKRLNERRRMAEAPLDLLVVGGGIVGSGVARDAAMRGLRTAVVDRYDFAYGTSSRSSRLLHGGLRYLEQGRVGLVHEASVEKKTVHHIAPHLGQPLAFVFPIYKKGGYPLWQMRIGVKIYDLLCGGRNFSPSRGFSLSQTTQMLPGVNQDGLLGAVRYFDALTNDARLVIDTIRSAAKAGAMAANYTKFEASRRVGDLWECDLVDTFTGEKFTLKARTVLNATGPWAEGVSHSSVKLRLSKGIHVVIDRKRLPVSEAVVVTEKKRILFVIPWGERLIVGTTDTDYHADPEDVSVDAEDITYVLNTVNETFPELKLAKEDIISSWAGLRPLLANPDGTPSDISRAHEIRRPVEGWWDVAGGKLTTYRLMAEQAVTQIVKYLKVRAPKCQTADIPLLPAEEAERYSGILPAPYGEAAVKHYVASEWAISLSDIMLRRSGWQYYDDNAAERAVEVATWMCTIAGWTNAEREAQLAEYYSEARKSYSRSGSVPQETANHAAH